MIHSGTTFKYLKEHIFLHKHMGLKIVLLKILIEQLNF